MFVSYLLFPLYTEGKSKSLLFFPDSFDIYSTHRNIQKAIKVMQPTKSPQTVEELKLERDRLREQVLELQREYKLYLGMIQGSKSGMSEKNANGVNCATGNISETRQGEENTKLQEEHDRLQSETIYLQNELNMLEEENNDLYDAIEVITKEKAQIESVLHEKKEALELSKNSIDFFVAERDGFIKEKETKEKMIKTFETLFSMH